MDPGNLRKIRSTIKGSPIFTPISSQHLPRDIGETIIGA
jgi:hypothetical protein